MRTLTLSLVSASLLALAACGETAETNNASSNTLGTESLPPLDNGSELGNTGLDANVSGNTSLGADLNASGNASAGNSTSETNASGNSH